jgi:hypothetical protein
MVPPRLWTMVQQSPRVVDIRVNLPYDALMDMSTTRGPSRLLREMASAAKARFATDAGWAEASGLPKETLSRLKGQRSCDLRTLDALARAVGYTLTAVPTQGRSGEHVPARFDREYEERLLDLAASGNADAETWRTQGPGFFMAGLAVMLGSARGFERERYLRLAETLHPGVSTPEAFGQWLKMSPVRPSRFLPMARRRKRLE